MEVPISLAECVCYAAAPFLANRPMLRLARNGVLGVLLGVAWISGLLGCDDRVRATRVLEPYVLVPGTPTVDTATPEVKTDPTRATDNFSVNVPRQCDAFQQVVVRKVDILWVVDSSGSMAPKQQRLKDSFRDFIDQLVQASPPIDFNIAVISTDTDDPNSRGTLRPWRLGNFAAPFIACEPQVAGGILCNTAATVGAAKQSAIDAFGQMADVGTAGSAQERGLYAAYLALTNSDNVSTPSEARFIRPDAALYVVIVSDEDDSSCNPQSRQAICTADPGCRCANDTALAGAGAWGSTDYFVRFFETYKGYGNADLVSVAAIVATDDGPDASVPSQFLDASPHSGCCIAADGGSCPKTGLNAAVPDSGIEVAYFGSRYVKVAEATGGAAVSICDPRFSVALASLGYAASGLRRDFRLTRGPQLPMGNVGAAIELLVAPPTAATCMVTGNCPANQVCRNGRCAKSVPVSSAVAANGAQYVKCENGVSRNAVRFSGTAVPESLSTVEVCYDVDVSFQNTCP